MFKALLCGVAVTIAFSMPATAGDFSGVLDKVKLPAGFKISVFAEMPKPRQIEVGKPNGVVFVGSRHGHIYSLIDSNRDGVADEVLERVNGLNVPNGVAMQDSMLYVGMQDKIAHWPIPAEFDSALPLQPLLPVAEGLKNEFCTAGGSSDSVLTVSFMCRWARPAISAISKTIRARSCG